MPRTPIPSKLFIHKVLLSLQFIQGLDKNKSGATARRISSYIKRNFPNDGDVSSQVQASLDECEHYGFVERRRNKYFLVGPVACVQMQPHNSLHREKEVERVRKIFPYDWKHSRRRHYLYNRGRERKQGIFSSFFRTVKGWFFGSPSNHDDIVRLNRARRRIHHMNNLRKMRRRRKRCSRSGCAAPFKPDLELDASGDDFRKEKRSLGSISCEELKKKRDHLRKRSSALMEKYRTRCELNQRRKDKRKRDRLRSTSSPCTSDDVRYRDSLL